MLEPSKETTRYVVERMAIFMRSVLPFSDDMLGLVSVIIHILFGVCIIGLLVFGKVNSLYYLYIFLWGLVIYSNYFFHGCILSRLERYLFDNKNWCGPVSLTNHLLEIFGITVNKDIANTIIKYLIAAPICTMIILKLFFNGNLIIPILFSILWLPLLFIHSQKSIFESIKKPVETLHNKVIAVTGCSSGIGKELVISLLDMGATVIFLNRKSDNSIKLCKLLENKNFVDIECDLTNIKSVKTASNIIINKFPDGIDVLYVNAGISNQPLTITNDNYEIHIQTNYLSHVLLINGIFDLINKKKGKIINTSSIAYNIPFSKHHSKLFEKNPNISNLNSQFIYQQSKLAMLLYLKKLGEKIDVINVQPGICSSELLYNSVLPYPLPFLLGLISSSSKQGSKYLIEALTKNPTNKFIGPNIFFMDFNKIDPKLVNDDVSNKVYNDTHTHLGLAL